MAACPARRLAHRSSKLMIKMPSMFVFWLWLLEVL
jgi:hypothetical protein